MPESNRIRKALPVGAAIPPQYPGGRKRMPALPAGRPPAVLLRPVLFCLLLNLLLLAAVPATARAALPGETITSGTILSSLTEQERDWLRKHPVIRIAQDPGWQPIEFADKQGEPSGMAGDYLRLIEQRLGVKFERVKGLNWQEAYAMLKRWEIDMTTSVAVTPERTQFWEFTRPYMTIPVVIVARADVTYISNMQELAGKKIAVVDGYAVNDWIPRDFPEIRLVRVKTVQEGFETLHRGEVFAFVDNMLVVGYYMAKLKRTDLKIAGETPYVNAQCMAVRKDWPLLAGIIQKALESISETERNDIYKKCLPIRYEHGFDYSRFWKILGIFTVIFLGLLFWIEKLSREIRSRKKAEAALMESEAKFRLIFEAANVGKSITKPTGEIMVNKALCDMLGYTREELEHKKWQDVSHPDEIKGNLEVLDSLLRGERESVRVTKRYLHKDGSTVWSDVSIAVLRDGEADPQFFITTMIDITARKLAEEEKRLLEERLQRTEKMEALGLMAGGVAHDLNNIIGIAVGYAELISHDLDKSSPLRESLRYIMDAGHQAAAVVQDLLTLARRGVANKTVLNVNRLVLDFQNSPDWEKLAACHPFVQLKTDLEPDLLNISASSVHMQKTLFNLVANASEAMPRGGLLTVRTANRYLDKPVSGYDNIREGDYIVLSVADEGEGISEHDLKHIFEPFYTRKIMGRSGTGLGLSVVWGTVKDQQGYIDVQSKEGRGTIFNLYFPITREGIRAEASALAVSEYTGRGESILVVDDVAGQRELAAAILTKLNYKVARAASGEEALAYLEQNSVDLLVLDMIMEPGMDGLDTYKRIRQINPGQKAIIVSGFSASDRVHAAQALGAGEYVKKPYVKEKLGLAVKKELGRKQPP